MDVHHALKILLDRFGGARECDPGAVLFGVERRERTQEILILIQSFEKPYLPTLSTRTAGGPS